MAKPQVDAFWSVTGPELIQKLDTTPGGLAGDEAQRRLVLLGANLLKPRRRTGVVASLASQFKSPILITLLAAVGLSFFLRETTNALIILAIVLVSSLLGFWQEWRATNTVNKLLAMVKVVATVFRDGATRDVPVEEVVPGDVVRLEAGDMVPADSLILEAKDLFVDEATLTGETLPAEKTTALLPPETPLAERRNSLFLGTHVLSGMAHALVVHTGKNTEFGKISETLRLRPPETEFEHGVHRFGYFLVEVTMILVVAIFAINVFLARPILESFLFSLALAVGLTPQLLPAIISVNLAHGARRLASEKVIVKRLSAIENFGSMDVLCADKTGTLTKGTMQFRSVICPQGDLRDKSNLYAYLNAYYQSGFRNPIDQALLDQLHPDISGYQKLDEVPYDFVRKRLTVMVVKEAHHLMIVKGAFASVMAVSSLAEAPDGARLEMAAVKEKIEGQFEELSHRGFRVLGLAYRDLPDAKTITRDDETNMVFLGLLVFYDPPKPGIVETIKELNGLGTSLKVISGDNRFVVKNLGEQLSLDVSDIITGSELREMSNEALLKRVTEVSLFAEIEPNQKERIINSLKKAGKVVGFLGDGINDAPALHAADVGISVDSAVDVAKEAADFVLLEKDLNILVDGVKTGRTTFANTLKYVFMATSANFGNMFSMAGASVFLRFLPMLPRQVLLTNLMTDFPEMTIATDNVDSELVNKPHRWNIGFIRRFMLTFGLLSTAFDVATFMALLFLLKANTEQFRTGWFIESVVSASLIVLVIRTRQPFFKSRPSKYLLLATFAVVAVTMALPLTGLGQLFGFVLLEPRFYLLLWAIVAAYIVAAEIAKRFFYRRVQW